MDAEQLKEGKARVDAVLVEPLQRDGMVRPARMKAADFEAFRADLCARLAYMSADGLAALREQILRVRGGARGDDWPAMVHVQAWAREIETPPASDSRLVRSMLKSQGAAADAGGYLVALYHHLKRDGVPRGSYGWGQIRERGADDARRVQIIKEQAARGAASISDLDWLRRFEALERRARAIIAEETAGAANVAA